jgi:hypothetical protein
VCVVKDLVKDLAVVAMIISNIPIAVASSFSVNVIWSKVKVWTKAQQLMAGQVFVLPISKVEKELILHSFTERVVLFCGIVEIRRRGIVGHDSAFSWLMQDDCGMKS